MLQAKRLGSIIIDTLIISKLVLSQKTIRFKDKLFKLFISMQFQFQLIAYYIIICILLGFIIIYVRRFVYPIILMTSYSTGYQIKFSNGVIKESIVDLVQSATIESDSQSESELSQLLLMKIYFKELLNHKLIEDQSFSRLKDFSQYYSHLNTLEANYTIDESALQEMVDNNYATLGNLRELIKVSFIFIPLLIQEASINYNKLSSVFLLPHRFAKSDLKYSHQGYFNYPTPYSLYNLKQNFIQINKLVDPLIDDTVTPEDLSSSTISEHEYKSFNWFWLRDYYFRVKAKRSDKETLTNIIFFNQAEVDNDSVNRSHYELFQFINENNPPSTPSNPNSNPLVINLILKYEDTYQSDLVERFSFAIQNSTFDLTKDYLLKYSDNRTYVITKNAISPLSLNNKYLNFFNYAFDRKDFLYNSNGVNFDTFDLERFNDINLYFTIPKEKQGDILLFKTMQMMYSVMIQKIHSSKGSTSPSETYYLYNFTDQDGIKTICDSVNLLGHYQLLQEIDFKTNCLSDSQLYFYLHSHDLEYDTKVEGAIPDCVCLPFYCLNITESDIENDYIEYTNALYLPNSCESTMNTYYSPQSIESQSKESKIEENIFSKNTIFFKYKNLPYLESIDILNVHNYFNYHILKAESHLSKELNDFVDKSMNMNIAVYALLTFIFLILTIYQSVKENNILIDFISKHKEYLFKRNYDVAKPKSNINQIENELNPFHINNQAQDNFEQSLNESNEGLTLISNIEATKDNDNNEQEYFLIDDLFETYIFFNKLDKNTIIQQLEKKRVNKDTALGKLKTNYLQKQNELFEVLAWFSYSMPKYQLSIKSEINFYKSNPLIRKYNVTKRKQMRTIPSMSLKPSKEALGFSQSILCELLSTEAVFDEGIVINLRYNYKNYLQPNIYSYLSSPRKKKLLNSTTFKLKEKKRDELFQEFEQECKANDVFKLEEIKSAFNYYLTEIFHPSLRFIYLDMSYEQSRNCLLKSKSLL